ncbi:hypothetical protein HPB49_003387 [Dermacentor silvarum]|uniref:Uncharacterized protein n=1 Tax=Dermacentor silvarum TaxID=543639 RepID=A0ACB8D2N8_DERSI|nr:hypothetical protein HPB49_003387 [Dermacentor silvarum]
MTSTDRRLSSLVALSLIARPRSSVVRSWAHRRRHSYVASNALAVRTPIQAALSALPGVKEVRVNTKKNIVAADAASPEWTEHLLATSEIAGMPVTARLPADRTQSSGVVQGVHGNYTDEYLLAAVSWKVRVVAAKRQGTTLVLRFATPYPPARIYIFSMPFEVRPSRPRPLQCLRCGCYGHATATCQRPVRCLRCGGPHQMQSCCSSRVRCLHCGGPHPADSPNCQLWQRERRLATIKASAPTHLSHREAQAEPTTSTNHPQPHLQQRVPQAGAKKWGSIKLGPSPKEAPQECHRTSHARRAVIGCGQTTARLSDASDGEDLSILSHAGHPIRHLGIVKRLG